MEVRRAPPIPPETWDWLSRTCCRSAAGQLGSWAELHHDEEITERAWTHALQAEDEPGPGGDGVAERRLGAVRVTQLPEQQPKLCEACGDACQ
ncbi:MAG: hypothetical protein ACRDYA_09890 [Egibacteraceae bacterium]